jgi:hypothetical protein
MPALWANNVIPIASVEHGIDNWKLSVWRP